MDLQQLRVFARVAELGSFSRAADQLGMVKGRVSAAVQHLELQVGARLLHRTTRQVRLTPEGEAFLDRCQELLADAEQLQAMFQPAAAGLRGRVRIDVPNTFARDLFLPRLPEFLAAHPLLEVGISSTDQRVDVVREGFDCVLRVGTLADSELVVRPLGVLPMVNVASPAYLRERGTPRNLADLAQHRIVHYAARLGTQGAGWEYEEGGARRLLVMKAAVVVNSTDAYQAACLAGLGLIQAPVRGTRQLVRSGALVEVLTEYTAPAMPISLLYPHRRHVPPRVQAMLQWMEQLVRAELGHQAGMSADPRPDRRGYDPDPDCRKQ
jgi:DNA-binding transcriptional LysR family regulator